jgi:hypothetical protein
MENTPPKLNVVLTPSKYLQSANYFTRGVILIDGVKFYTDIPEESKVGFINAALKNLNEVIEKGLKSD